MTGVQTCALPIWALMSMIGSSLLNRTISERKILAPGKILENVHMGIRARLRQAEANSGDGMVISMASIEKKPDNMFNITFAAARSEEHTSELQSLTNLVCRLLLEKKKKQKTKTNTTIATSPNQHLTSKPTPIPGTQ